MNKMNLYLFSPVTQSFFHKSKHHHNSVFRHIERRLRQLFHQARQDNLSAVIHANLIYRHTLNYISDIESEIKKYMSTIKSQELIKQLRAALSLAKHSFSDLNSLVNALNRALIVTDRLVVLLMVAKNNQIFEEERTFYSLCTKIRKKLFGLFGRINSLSFDSFKAITVFEFFNQSSSYPDAEKNKVMSILDIGFIKKYKNREVQK